VWASPTRPTQPTQRPITIRAGARAEHLVEERLSVGKGKLLGFAQEFFPRGGVECGTQTGRVLFGESDRACVEVGEKLRKLRGDGPGLSCGDRWRRSRCRGGPFYGGTEPRQ
jgi:hypothetical protein